MKITAILTKKVRGFSLIELMIALVLGLILILGITMMVTNSSNSYRELSKTSAQIDNGRYAMQLLMDDLNHAGFYGSYFPQKGKKYQGLQPSACVTAVGSLEDTIGTLAVQGFKGDDEPPTECITSGHQYKLETDVLLVRRTSTNITTPKNLSKYPGRLFLHVHSLHAPPGIDPSFSKEIFAADSSDESERCEENKKKIGANTFIKTGSSISSVICTDDLAESNPAICVHSGELGCFEPGISGDIRALIANLYFISNCDVCTGPNADNVPTLKMRQLESGGFSNPISLVRGIDQMRVFYGVDDTGDGAPNRIVRANEVDNGGGYAQWSDVVTVEVFLLVRNEESTPGYKDQKVYLLAPTSTTDDVIGPLEDSFKRHLYRSSIRLNNIGDRRR